MRICVLDLGGMSFHLMHARRVTSDLEILGNLRLPTAIGSETMQTGVLSTQAYAAGLRDLAILSQEVRVLAPDRVIAVATSAIRAASNAHTFIAEVRKRFGLSIKVLSGEEEAKFSYRGAASELGSWTGSLATIDLGGGSCEIAVGEGGQCQYSYSADIGVLPIKEAFGVQDRLSFVTACGISEMVRLSLSSAPKRIIGVSPDKLLLASGNARAVYKLASALLDRNLSGQLSVATLREMRTLVIGRHPREFIAYGLPLRRAEFVAIAIVLLETIMATMHYKVAEISQRGLREGVALHEFATATPLPSQATPTSSVSTA